MPNADMPERFWSQAKDADVERHRARTLNWSGRALSNRLSAPEIITLGADAAAALSRPGGSLVAYCGTSHEEGDRANAEHLNAGRPLLASVGVEVSDSLGHGGLDELLAAEVHKTFSGECVLVPIVWDGRAAGLVAVQTGTDETDGHLVSHATVLAEQIALALQICSISEQLYPHVAPTADGPPTVEANGRLVTNVVDSGAEERMSIANPPEGDDDSDDSVDSATQTLLSSVAHDLRSPLAMVQMYTDFLGDRTGDDLQQPIQQMRMACRHLDAMIRNLLDFKMLESRGRVVKVAAADPAPVAREATTLCLSSGDHREIKVRQATDLWALFDRDILRQILVNLLSNAVKFTPPEGQIDILIREESTTAELGARRSIAVDVRDEGSGIDAEALPKIFAPYYRTRSGEGFSGLGLGLAISHILTEKLGGLLRVQSEVGEGSTFSVILPAAPTGDGPKAGQAYCGTGTSEK